MLTEGNYDWEGTHAFDEHGRVDPSRCTGPVNMMMRPLPRIGDKMHAELEEADTQIAALLVPCSPAAFMATLTRLAQHCPMQNREPSMLRPMLLDYQHDLGHLPFAVLEDVCIAYRRRRVPDGEANWFPTTRQLLDLAWPTMQGLKRTQRRIHRLLGKPLEVAGMPSRGANLSDVLKRINAGIQTATEEA